jgi:predicted DsbA family dithiol-disulfide isomerase
MLQLRVKGEWRSVYAWRDVHAPMVDLECYNWFSCTYPTARFTTSFFVCRVVGKNERHHILNGEYVVRKGLGIDKEQTSTVIADRKELLDLLEKVFNIHLGINDMEGHIGRIDRYLPSVKAESAPSSVKPTNMIQETKSFGRNSGDGDGIIEIIVVVDFMCPWTYIGLRCLELAMQKRVTNDDVRFELVPYEFDNLGTYPSVGIGWVDYCNSFGPTKARYLLDDKLPRAFATAESVGIGLRLERRIVHTHNINFALIKAQQGDGQVALAFALRALRDHFEGLHDPNTPELINKQLLEAGVSTEVTAEVIATIRRGCCADDHSTMALLLLAQKRAQDLGAPPVPLFVVRYDGIIVESDAIGPVTPEYFDSIFQRCLPIR